MIIIFFFPIIGIQIWNFLKSKIILKSLLFIHRHREWKLRKIFVRANLKTFFTLQMYSLNPIYVYIYIYAIFVLPDISANRRKQKTDRRSCYLSCNGILLLLYSNSYTRFTFNNTRWNRQVSNLLKAIESIVHVQLFFVTQYAQTCKKKNRKDRMHTYEGDV